MVPVAEYSQRALDWVPGCKEFGDNDTVIAQSGLSTNSEHNDESFSLSDTDEYQSEGSWDFNCVDTDDEYVPNNKATKEKAQDAVEAQDAKEETDESVANDADNELSTDDNETEKNLKEEYKIEQ